MEGDELAFLAAEDDALLRQTSALRRELVAKHRLKHPEEASAKGERGRGRGDARTRGRGRGGDRGGRGRGGRGGNQAGGLAEGAQVGAVESGGGKGETKSTEGTRGGGTAGLRGRGGRGGAVGQQRPQYGMLVKKRKSPQLLLKQLTIQKASATKRWDSASSKLQLKLFLGKHPQTLEVQIDENRTKRIKLPFSLEALKEFHTVLNNDTVSITFTVTSLGSLQTGSVQKSEDTTAPSKVVYEELTVEKLLDDTGHSSDGHLSVSAELSGGKEKMEQVQAKFLPFILPSVPKSPSPVQPSKAEAPSPSVSSNEGSAPSGKRKRDRKEIPAQGRKEASENVKKKRAEEELKGTEKEENEKPKETKKKKKKNKKKKAKTTPE